MRLWVLTALTEDYLVLASSAIRFCRQIPVLWGIPLPLFSVLFYPEDAAAGCSEILVLRL
jgi:hypothetical protein